MVLSSTLEHSMDDENLVNGVNWHFRRWKRMIKILIHQYVIILKLGIEGGSIVDGFMLDVCTTDGQ